ncbi:TPA: hypothetical protein HJ942_004036 [Escherichia coli]|nr:hypothetical protein [Escherichia coli]MED0063780.1 hypothetical protein [Escherichia marmotae]MED8778061.1 hypothetical protein [Escherichia marmotae]HAI8717059.1 hypothetical protein [Escherichia coli]
MGKVIKFKPKVSVAKSDPWCAPLILDNGKQISGGAAREKRLKAIGGVEELLRQTLVNATNIASRTG